MLERIVDCLEIIDIDEQKCNSDIVAGFKLAREAL